MTFWEKVKQQLQKNVEILRSTEKVYKFFKVLFKEGIFEVITPFEFKNQQLSFRTIIHADADMYHYFPDLPKKQKEHSAYHKKMKEVYTQHAQRVTEVFSMFNDNKRFWEYIVDLSLVFINVGPVAYSIDQATLESVTYSVASIAFSILVRPWLKKKAVRVVLKLGMQIVKRYVNL